MSKASFPGEHACQDWDWNFGHADMTPGPQAPRVRAWAPSKSDKARPRPGSRQGGVGPQPSASSFQRINAFVAHAQSKPTHSSGNC